MESIQGVRVGQGRRKPVSKYPKSAQG